MIITTGGALKLSIAVSGPTFADHIEALNEQHELRQTFDWGRVEGPGQHPHSTGVCDGCDRVVDWLAPSSDGRALFCSRCLPAAETAILEAGP